MGLTKQDKEWMEAKFETVSVRLDSYNRSLEEHKKRTTQIEDEFKEYRAEHKKDVKEYRNDIKSDRKWVIGTGLVVAGLIIAVMNYMHP